MRLLWALLAASSALWAQKPEECHKHKYYGRKAQAEACFEKLAEASDAGLRAEGLWGLGAFQPASDTFKAAVAMKPKDPALRTRWGRLFLERYNKQEAAKLFQEALVMDEKFAPALVAMAIVASEGFDVKAVQLAEEALKSDPKMLEAQELLAKLAVEDVNFTKAREEAEKALKIAPDAMDAMAVLAAVDILADKKDTPWLARIAAINPKYAVSDSYIAQTLILNRRYLEGIDYFKKALDKDPQYWYVHSQLGISYMRLGMDKPAREHLEIAYENGWRDAATANTLKLMDSYKNFKIYKTANSELRLDAKEADLLKLYFEPELRKAIAVFEKKYKFKLKQPVRLEVYPNHDDFAVRTMGMPGLGALGVTFGYVVAMDSPSGRKPGGFHWASTLWHELSHVFVLAATDHRVPRWFTEGLAVHEETQVAPDWGDRLDPHVLQIIKDKKLLPIATLDRGFIRPTYPQQVIVSYFQAGRICDYIHQKWGWQKLLDMMHAFSTQSTVEVVEKHLGMKPEAFDKEFLAWLEKDVAKPLSKFEEWSKRRMEMVKLVKEKKWDEVIKEGNIIRDWFPDFVEGFSIYEMLAEAYEEKGDKKATAAQLEAYAKVGGRFPANLKHLADMLVEQGRGKDAAVVLDKLNYIYPVQDPEMHQKLGELEFGMGRLEPAIREFQAALASKPPDPAATHFQLAQAYAKAKQSDRALEHVVSALEAAPGFKPAQKLLLELTSTNKKED